MRPSRSFALAVSAALTGTLLTTAPSVATAATPTDPPTPSIPQRYLDQEIDWAPCSFDAQVKQLYPAAPTTNCAMVDVPMDWQNPDDHPDIQVAIAYSEATGDSRGLMMTNPGGPGGAGLTLSAGLAVDKPQLFSDYDLVGFDPRGFGRSTPLQCLATAEEVDALPVTPDYKERTELTHRVELAEAELLAEACSSTEYGEFVSSQQTVDDMEFIRALLGSEKLNFIGYSYGTWLGGWYADAYPDRVDRFVIDSNMDWTHTQWENVNFDPFSGQRRRDAQLFPWIARQQSAGTLSGLGSTPAEVKRTYDTTRARIVERYKAGEITARGDSLDSAIYSAIYSNSRFTSAAATILSYAELAADPSASALQARHVDRAWSRLSAELRSGDTLDALRGRLGVGGAGSADAPRVETIRDVLADARTEAAAATSPDATINLGAIGTTVRCNDTSWDRQPRFYQLEADRMARKYDFFGYMNGVPMCAYWPHQPQDRELDLTGSPQLLMVQGEFDPATSYEGAWRTHTDVPAATRFIAIDDEGQHGQYIGSASACAEAIGDAFVFDGVVPAENQVCTTGPLPNESRVFPVVGPVNGESVNLPPSRMATRTAAPTAVNPLLREAMDTVAANAMR